MKTIISFQCEKCGLQYEDAGECRDCEKQPSFGDFFNIGDCVKLGIYSDSGVRYDKGEGIVVGKYEKDHVWRFKIWAFDGDQLVDTGIERDDPFSISDVDQTKP